MQDVRVVMADRIFVRLPKKADQLFLELTRGFEHHNAKHFILEKMGKWTGGEPRKIITWECGADADPAFEVLTFPRGGLQRIRTAFQKAGERLILEDARCDGISSTLTPLTHNRTLFAHQVRLCEVATARENCLVRSPTGSGKTTAILALIAQLNLAALVVVPNKKLLKQWIDRAVDELSLKRSEIGVVGDGKFKPRRLTIGIQKSVAIKAAKNEAFRNSFGIVVADEVDLFAAKTFFASIDVFPARYRIGVSADHRRKDRKEFLIFDLFGDVDLHIEHADLVKSGHVLDVRFEVIPTDFRADWYGKQEFVIGTGNDNDEPEKANYDTARLLREMLNDGDRNRLAINAARDLLSSGGQCFVLAEYREHCHVIENAIRGMGTKTGFLIGGDDYRTEFDRTVAGLAAGTIKCGIGTYKALARGIDVPRVGDAVGVTPIASNEQLVAQTRGRVCRTSTGKTGARFRYLWDRYVFPDHLANLARWNANTVVLHDNAWMPAKQYIKMQRAA